MVNITLFPFFQILLYIHWIIHSNDRMVSSLGCYQKSYFLYKNIFLLFMANLDVALSMYSKNGKEQVMSFISERYAIFVSVSDCFRFLPTPKTSVFSSITELTH